VHDAVLSAS